MLENFKFDFINLIILFKFKKKINFLKKNSIVQLQWVECRERKNSSSSVCFVLQINYTFLACISHCTFSSWSFVGERNINCMAMKFKHMAMACLEFNCGHRAISVQLHIHICMLELWCRENMCNCCIILGFGVFYGSPLAKNCSFRLASSLCACYV